MKLILRPEAQVEVEDAIAFYELQQAGLGGEFADELDRGYDAILDGPDRWPRLRGDVRRRLLKRFPYGVLYIAHADTVFVLAVMHLNRDPGYWIDRVP